MHHADAGYTADDILVQFICSEIIIEFDLSDEFHASLCRWAVEILNSNDVRNDLTKILLESKLRKAHELLTSQFH